MKVLAIIPARGGSKGIPNKNIKQLGGIPLLAYPILAAQKSKMLTEIACSTDSQEIASIAKLYGCDTVFRPEGLGSDYSPVIDSVIHTLNVFESKGKLFDIVVLLQPTSPFWNADDLDSALSFFEDRDTDGVISVVPSREIHPSRMYSLDSKSHMESLSIEEESVRRQDLKPVYLRNGCIYACRTEVLRRDRTLMPKSKKAYIMDPEWFLTIDTPRDLKLAEVMVHDWPSN